MSERWTIPEIWSGGEAFVMGGGPSLRGFDWARLRGRHVVGCNDAYEHGDVVDVVAFGDMPFWRRRGDHLVRAKNRHGFLAVTNFPNSPEAFVGHAHIVRRLRHKWSRSQEALCWLGNTGAMAVNLAARLGARRIVLLGFDMDLGPGGATNWYEDNRRPPTRKLLDKFLGTFEEVARGCREEGIELINANPRSRIDYGIPKVSPEDLL